MKQERVAITFKTKDGKPLETVPKKESMYQRLKRLSKVLSLHTDDPKFSSTTPELKTQGLVKSPG